MKKVGMLVRLIPVLVGGVLLARDNTWASDHAKGKKCVEGTPPQNADCSTGPTTNAQSEANSCTGKKYQAPISAYLVDTDDPYRQDRLKTVTRTFITAWPCRRRWHGPSQPDWPNGYYTWYCRDEDKVEEPITWYECE